VRARAACSSCAPVRSALQEKPAGAAPAPPRVPLLDPAHETAAQVCSSCTIGHRRAKSSLCAASATAGATQSRAIIPRARRGLEQGSSGRSTASGSAAATVPGDRGTRAPMGCYPFPRATVVTLPVAGRNRLAQRESLLPFRACRSPLWLRAAQSKPPSRGSVLRACGAGAPGKRACRACSLDSPARARPNLGCCAASPRAQRGADPRCPPDPWSVC
jgi:hypothetical protein